MRDGNIRARHFVQDASGKYLWEGTHFLANDTTYANLPERIPNLKEGDIVYVFDFYLRRQRSPYTGEVKWLRMPPADPEVRGLWTMARQAENAAASPSS